MTPDREHGWALVSVLWALTMLALMAAATEALTATSYRIEQHAIVEARARSVLDAAVVRAVLGISDLRPGQRWRADGAHRAFAFEGVSVDVSVQDESGRIDLNASGAAQVVQLLSANGLAPDAASSLADRILAWRTPAGPGTLKGGSDDDYRTAGLPYVPRHGPFQSVGELGLVLGMTPQLFARIGPALTVYSRQANFDSSLAPPQALLALYPDDPGKIDTIMRARTGDPNAVAGWGSASGTGAVSPAGRAFSITAAAAIGNRTFRRIAVVQMTGDDRAPYYVMDWQ